MKIENIYQFSKLTADEKQAFDAWLEASDFSYNSIERCWCGFTDKGLIIMNEHKIIREFKRSFMPIAKQFKNI